jgi:hypothetical protein
VSHLRFALRAALREGGAGRRRGGGGGPVKGGRWGVPEMPWGWRRERRRAG